MNTPPFRFVIPATHQPFRQTLAVHLLVSFVLFAAGLFCLTMYWYTGVSPNFKVAISAFGIFGALCFLGSITVYILSVSAVRRARFSGMLRLLELALLGIGAALFFYSGWDVPAVLFLVLALLATAAAIFEKRVPADTVIEVDEKGVQKRAGLKTKLLPWHNLQRVLYRRGILTIDALDNRLQQYAVSAPEIDSQIFEAFCAQQVAAAIPKRRKDDW